MLWKITVVSYSRNKVVFSRTYETERGFLNGRDYYSKVYGHGKGLYELQCYIIPHEWERVP